MADFTQQTDGISLESLRLSGATKWAGDDGSIGAFVAEMDFGVAPAITEALHRAVDDGFFGYMPKNLSGTLREATAAYYGSRFDWELSAEDVWPVPDVIKALQLAIEHHSEPGTKVIVPTPAYMPFLLIPPYSGREVIQVPMTGECGGTALDMDGLQAAFDAGGSLLILCNPYNPVGRVFTRAELIAISELVERNKGRVFADEIWAPLVYGEGKHIPYASVNEAAAGHTLTAISASKAWNLPGLKCAQVITSNDADREKWQRIGFFAGHGTSNLGAVANTAAYANGGGWLKDAVRYLDRNRKALSGLVEQHLPGVRYREPEGTYIGWLDFRDTKLASAPAEFFKQHANVHMTDGASCGEEFDGFARFIFATPHPIMVEAFERMGEAWRAHDKS